LRRLILLVASLVMLLVSTAALALAQTGPGGENQVRCLLPERCGPAFQNGGSSCTLPEGCGPTDVDEPLCFLPEGCDTNGDGVPDFKAGEPVPSLKVRAAQYDNAV
jgi:hypothetical protein